MPRPPRNIEQKAAEVLRDLRIDGPEVDVQRIAEAHGALVRYVSTDDDVSGMLHRDQGGRPVIGINAAHHSNRQRFTLAHEIGHLLLHEGETYLDTPRMAVRMRDERSATGTDLEEIQANKFAAALLMPVAFLRRDLRDPRLVRALPHLDDDEFARLANRYGVSTQALTLRLVNLGWLKPDPEI